MGILLIGKQFNSEKERLYKLQNGKCPLCKRDLNEDTSSNHLDHDHELRGPNAGKIRALLCVYCNVLEGQIKHKFNSSGLKSENVDISEWLESLANYYRQDISSNNVHPKFVNDLSKLFSRLNLSEMDELANEYNIKFEDKTTKAKRLPIFKKQLKQHLKALL